MPASSDIKKWLPIAAAKMDEMKKPEREGLLGLIDHARDSMGSSTGPKPSKRWFDQGEVWISKIGVAVFDGFIPNFIEEAAISYKNDPVHGWKQENINERAKREFMVGGSWLVSLSPSRAGIKAVASAFKPSPNGTGNELGNATRKVLLSIGSSDSPQSLEAIRQIKRLMALYPIGNEGHQFRLGYAAIGKAKNLSIKELDALTETDFDTDRYKDFTAMFGAYSGKIVLEESGKVTIFWIGPNEKPLKNEPTEVKKKFERELKELKEKVKDIRTTVSLRSRRLEGELRSEVPRAYGAWRNEFLENPVAKSIAERLIWKINGKHFSNTALVHGDDLVDVDGNVLGKTQDVCEIKLWHPLDSDTQEVLRWRKRIESLKIVQPFKQTHREVYILTDAERKDAFFSGRFSSHILKGRQFLNLCHARNWKCSRWKNSATVEVDDLNMSAVLQLDWEIDLNEGCPSYLTPSYVFTGKIGFFKSDLQCPLEEVPPKIFSEIMRDVDLFVGVSSVGNDPNWRDHGNRMASNYWQTYAFGELSASAETRRDLLERLLPNLADLSDRCHLENRFLVVKGDLRTYRIHLGSSNIQMEPDNQYLCIVPSKNIEPQDEEETIFLPFIGDATLSLIISKALLLANDRNIKDAMIMSQIRP